MDIKHLTAGTTLYLPVAAQGALFSVGDTHAAMGDAEVCGTAVESAMTITVRLTTLKNKSIPFPQYRIPPGQLAQQETSGYHVCTGIDFDLTEAAKQATRATIDHIEQTHGIDRQTAYAIASAAVDLRIHELVDAPNWVVGAFLPDAIFTEPANSGGPDTGEQYERPDQHQTWPAPRAEDMGGDRAQHRDHGADRRDGAERDGAREL